MYPGGIMTLYDHPVAQMPLNQFLCTIFSFIEMQWVCRCGSGSESGEGGRLDVRLPQVCAVHSHSQKCSEHIFVLVATPWQRNSKVTLMLCMLWKSIVTSPMFIFSTPSYLRDRKQRKVGSWSLADVGTRYVMTLAGWIQLQAQVRWRLYTMWRTMAHIFIDITFVYKQAQGVHGGWANLECETSCLKR